MEEDKSLQKIRFTTEEGEEVEFCVVEQTKLNGVDYLLVTEDADNGEEEADAYILKDTSTSDSEEAIYCFVEDDKELDAVASIFDELLDDTDIVS